MRRRTALTALTPLPAALTACGGGGGDTAAAPPPPSPPALQTPEVSWPTPAPISWGTALSAAQLNASAAVPGSFVYAPAAGSRPEVGNTTLSATFTPQDATRYRTVTLTRTLRVDKARPALRWDAPAAVAQGAALTAAGLGTAPRALYGVQGTADSAGLVDGRPLAEATASAGTAVLRARFQPQDTAHYEAAWVHTLLSVRPAGASAGVDFGATRQTIQGFGGSAAWYYTPMSAARADVLFGTQGDDALGLSILRLRIAPAAWNAAAQTADTQAWAAEMGNATAAQARGALVFASAWSPPASLKLAHPERRDPLWSGRLNPEHYAAYAQYLNAYIRYAGSRGVTLHAISPQNEPDWDPADYESCLWSPDELKDWIAHHGAAAVAGTSTLLMAPESLNFSPATTDTLMADAAVAARIGILGGHLYGGVPQYPSNAPGKPVWMTEHFLDSVNKSDSAPGWATSIDDALAIAREVHEGFALGQYNAYVHWWLVNSSDQRPTGLIDAANKPNHFGLGLKHFAWFIRPGLQRVEATAEPLPGVKLTAYASPAGAASPRAVLVLINANAQEQALDLAIQPAGRMLQRWTPYVTSATARFERQAEIQGAPTLPLRLAAKSITTLVTP
jgi:O-glycosyl hydrolase